METVKESVSTEEEATKKRRKNRAFLFFTLSVVIINLILLSWALYQKGRAERALAKNQRILNSMYFYADNYALVVQRDSAGHFRYGFMDKEGYMRIDYQYTEAEPFDEYGYARVKLFEKLYLIDTLNRRYPLAESVKAITDSTLAVSLKEQYLEEMPKEIVNNPQLQVLLLRGNQFKTLPKEIGQLKQLKTLDLGYNQLKALPKAIENLTELEFLDLQQNQFDTLKLQLTGCRKMKVLNLSRNYLSSFPKLGNLESLEHLDVSKNNIKELGDDVGDLVNIKFLNLFGNQIQSIPTALKNQKGLTIILKGDELQDLQKGTANSKSKTTKPRSKNNSKETSEEENKTKVDLSNYKNVFTRNEMRDGKRILHSKLIECSNQNYFMYQVKLRREGDHYFWEMVYTDASHHPKGDQGILLIDKNGVKTTLAFPNQQVLIRYNNRKAFKQQALLQASDLEWLAQHPTASIQLQNDAGIETFPRGVAPQASLDIQKAAKGLLEELQWEAQKEENPSQKDKGNSNQNAPKDPFAQNLSGDDANINWDEYMSWDCSDAYVTNDAIQKRIILRDVVLFISLKDNFDYRCAFKYENGMLLAEITTADRFPLEKGQVKIMFLSATGEKKVFDFVEYMSDQISIQGQPGYRNSLLLNIESLDWIVQNDIQSFRVIDMLEQKMYPYAISPVRSQELREAAACMLKRVKELQ